MYLYFTSSYIQMQYAVRTIYFVGWPVEDGSLVEWFYKFMANLHQRLGCYPREKIWLVTHALKM